MPHLHEHQALTMRDLQPYAPDLVFTATLVQSRLAEELTNDQWKVIHFDPRSVDDVLEVMRTLGLLLDVTDRGRAIAETLRRDLRAVEKKASLLPRKQRVYVEEWHNPPMVSGNWVPDIVRCAGGVPFPLPAGSSSRAVTLEEIAAFDPDLIVLSICGAGSFADVTLLTGRPGWSDLRAVRNKAVKVIDDSLLNRPGPRLADGARRIFTWLFERAHGA